MLTHTAPSLPSSLPSFLPPSLPHTFSLPHTVSQVEIVANDLGSRITPSWVAFTDEGEQLVVRDPRFLRNVSNILGPFILV
jgi:hypothetical protein